MTSRAEAVEEAAKLAEALQPSLSGSHALAHTDTLPSSTSPDHTVSSSLTDDIAAARLDVHGWDVDEEEADEEEAEWEVVPLGKKAAQEVVAARQAVTAEQHETAAAVKREKRTMRKHHGRRQGRGRSGSAVACAARQGGRRNAFSPPSRVVAAMEKAPFMMDSNGTADAIDGPWDVEHAPCPNRLMRPEREALAPVATNGVHPVRGMGTEQDVALDASGGKLYVGRGQHVGRVARGGRCRGSGRGRGRRVLEGVHGFSDPSLPREDVGCVVPVDSAGAGGRASGRRATRLQQPPAEGGQRQVGSNDGALVRGGRRPFRPQPRCDVNVSAPSAVSDGHGERPAQVQLQGHPQREGHQGRHSQRGRGRERRGARGRGRGGGGGGGSGSGGGDGVCNSQHRSSNATVT
jgi:hypothetical protein